MKKLLLLATLGILCLSSCDNKESITSTAKPSTSTPNINIPSNESNTITTKPSATAKPSTPNTKLPSDTIIPTQTPTPNPEDKEYSDSVELYKASVDVMKNLTYDVFSFGTSITDISGTGNPLPDPLYIYEKLQHKPNELYFEKISNGKPVMGMFGVSFAQKAYINNDAGRRQSASTKKPWTPFGGENPSKSYPNVTNYSEGVDKSKSDILTEFGMNGTSYINYSIDNDTITSDSLDFQKLDDGYKLTFTLVIDNGINSKSISGYKNQVKTMSGKELKSVEEITLEINLDNKLRVTSYTSNESYTVNFIVDAKINNTLSYSFNYYDNQEDLTINAF